METSISFRPDISIGEVNCCVVEFGENDNFTVESRQSVYLYVVLRGGLWVTVDGYEPAKLMPGSVALVGKPLEHSLLASIEYEKRARSTAPKYISTEMLGRQSLDVDYTSGFPTQTFVVRVPAETNLVPAVFPPLYLIPESSREEEFPGLWALLSLMLRGEFRHSGVGNDALLKITTKLIAEIFTIWGLTKQPKLDDANQVLCHDVRIRKVMTAIHDDVSYPWTLDELAGVANMSKSGLSRRFKDVVGNSPLNYLSCVRIQTAGSLLKTSPKPISDIALLSGYQSEYAFNKAFKKKVGITPGQFREASNKLVKNYCA